MQTPFQQVLRHHPKASHERCAGIEYAGTSDSMQNLTNCLSRENQQRPARARQAAWHDYIPIRMGICALSIHRVKEIRPKIVSKLGASNKYAYRRLLHNTLS